MLALVAAMMRTSTWIGLGSPKWVDLARVEQPEELRL